MKKYLISALLAVAAVGSASALEVGVSGGRLLDKTNRNVFGVSVGQKVGKFGLTGSVDRTAVGALDQNRFKLVGSYDVVKLGGVAVSAKAGAAYLHNQNATSGYALVAGVGVDVPVTKNVSLVADYSYQFGQNRVDDFNGPTVTVGAKYTF